MSLENARRIAVSANGLVQKVPMVLFSEGC